MVLDFNFDPQEDDEVIHQEEAVHQQEAVHDQEAVHQQEEVHDQEAVHQQEAVHDQEAIHHEGVHQEEVVHHEEKRNLTDKQRFAAYFALTVIERKGGQVHKKDKELIADLLKTSLITIDRIWKEAKH
jgi:hypothetical protein